jgi:hypothetical protein
MPATWCGAASRHFTARQQGSSMLGMLRHSGGSVQCGGMLPISVRHWVVLYPGVLVQCAVLSWCHLRTWCWDPLWLFLQVMQLLLPSKYLA